MSDGEIVALKVIQRKQIYPVWALGSLLIRLLALLVHRANRGYWLRLNQMKRTEYQHELCRTLAPPPLSQCMCHLSLFTTHELDKRCAYLEYFLCWNVSRMFLFALHMTV